MKSAKVIRIPKAISIFGAFTIYFYVLSITLYPFLLRNFELNPSLYWFITGYFLFIPLFIYSIFMVRDEGNITKSDTYNALSLYKLTGKDWKYVFYGTFLIFVLTGLIFGVSTYLHNTFGWRLLRTNPVFMEEFGAYVGWEKVYLLIWLPMFFFNIVGEELLWRGYIQNRMRSKNSWIICAVLWAMFHIPFGIDLIIMASPALIIIPYIFQKTKNTTTAIMIHGIYNGPIFVLISLGVISN